MSPEQKLKRIKFAVEWLEKLQGKDYMVFHSDKTSARVGESQGQIWVTRLPGEEYHADFLDTWHRGYTEMMFWGCYTSDIRGPSFMFTKETGPERQQARDDLNNRNAEHLAQQQVIREHLLAEQAKKLKSRHLKKISKPDKVFHERNKNVKGGID